MNNYKYNTICLWILGLGLLTACQEDIPESPSLVGNWEQIEKKSGDGWEPLGEGFYWTLSFYSDGTHDNQQGNFMSSFDCTGTWLVSGNRLTMENDCGRRKQSLSMHFSIEDSILTWIYEFSDRSEKFKRTD